MIKITEYKNHIIIDASAMKPDSPGWTPAGNGKIGCVTNLDNIKISKEAYNLFLSIPKSRDSIGDVMWWKTDNGSYYVGWIGGILNIVDVNTATGDRDYVPGGITEFIDNDPPQGAVDCLKQKV